MQRTEEKHSHAQNQPAVRQGKGASLETPQGEQISQIEAMAETSPQAGKLAQFATMVDNSSRMAAQRKAISAIHNSPHVTAQRQQVDSLLGETVQREEAEEPLQAKIAQREAAPAKPNNTGLPDNLKNGIESLSGMSMDNVKVHYNSSQPAQLNALAYAQRTDIHVAPGQEQHLPHEAWHVVQQAQGRVKPTMQMKEGVPVNDDRSLEDEADVMGAKAVQMRKEQEAKSSFVTQLTPIGTGGHLYTAISSSASFRADHLAANEAGARVATLNRAVNGRGMLNTVLVHTDAEIQAKVLAAEYDDAVHIRGPIYRVPVSANYHAVRAMHGLANNRLVIRIREVGELTNGVVWLKVYFDENSARVSVTGVHSTE